MSVVVSGIWNNFLKLGMPIAALAVVLLQGQAGVGRLIAALAGLAGLVGAIVVFALILRSEQFARKTGLVTQRWASSLLRRHPSRARRGWDIAVATWRGRVIGLVRKRWVPPHRRRARQSSLAVRRAARLPAHHGRAGERRGVGAGIARVRLRASRDRHPADARGGRRRRARPHRRAHPGGREAANVVAGVLLFRLLTYILPIVVGAGTYVFWRRNRSWRDSAPPQKGAMAEIASNNSQARRNGHP